MHDGTQREFALALITGGTGGIGEQIADGLASKTSTLVLPGRNQAKAAGTAAQLRRRFPDLTAVTEELDLESLASVRALCNQMLARAKPLDLLILNAGIAPLGQGPKQTSDGFGLVFETNYLGHFALIQGLMPLLREGAARVVIQLSLAAVRGRMDWRRSVKGSKQSALRAYQQSKIALGLMGMELARRSRRENWGISVQLCHPGVVPGSDIAPHLRSRVPGAVVDWVSAHLGNSVVEAAAPALAAALTSENRVRMFAPGGWLEVRGPVVDRAPFASLTDAAEASGLWARSQSLIGRVPAWSSG